MSGLPGRGANRSRSRSPVPTFKPTYTSELLDTTGRAHVETSDISPAPYMQQLAMESAQDLFQGQDLEIENVDDLDAGTVFPDSGPAHVFRKPIEIIPNRLVWMSSTSDGVSRDG